MDIQIISGFLGSGKTTFINKYLPLLKGKTVVIENEFGDISIDGSLIEGNAEIREITSGCICCSLSGDFRKTLTDLCTSVNPDHILIEPTGVGRLSDILEVCRKLNEADPHSYIVSKCITVVDVSDYEDFVNCFGDFYLDQIRHSGLLCLSHTDDLLPEKIKAICMDIKKYNPQGMIFNGDFRDLDDEMFLDLINAASNFTNEGNRRGNHAHDKDEIPAEGDYPNGHQQQHPHDHDHQHHQSEHDHTNDIFSAAVLRDIYLKTDTPQSFIDTLRSGSCGRILRGKGYVKTMQGELLYLDVTPGSSDFRRVDPNKAGANADVFIVIGCKLEEESLRNLS